MDRLEGGYLGAKPSWSTAASPGVWTLSQALARRAAGTWPATSSLFDPYFESVSLLLHMNGSNGSTTFVDSSLGNLAVTANGNAQISTAQSKFGGSSGAFDGTGDFLTLSSPTDFNLGSGDFTVELWAYFTSPVDASGDALIVAGDSTTNRPFGFYRTQTGIAFWLSTGGANYTEFGVTTTINTGQWYHFAATRTNNNVYVFINGVLLNTTSYSSTVANYTGSVYIGRFTWNVAGDLPGYIDEVRITRGVARYTANFAVFGNAGSDEGTALYDPYFDYVSLLLRCNGENNSTTFTDSSNNALAITRNGDTKISTTQARFGGASAYFDGTGDYLSTPHTTILSLESGDFTLEGWIYRNTSGAIHNLVNKRANTPASGYAWRVNANNTLQFFFTGGSSVTSTATVSVGRWTHVAVTRQGNAVRQFIDGALDATTATFSDGITNTTSVRIGIDEVAGDGFNGYIDDLRITKGVARYTTSFRPVGPYATSGKLVDPYLTSTSLLLPMTGDNGNTSFFDRSNNFLRATEYGNTKISTAISKFGLSSAYFDGSGDYLIPPNVGSGVLNWSSGLYTLEYWIYPVAFTQTTHGLPKSVAIGRMDTAVNNDWSFGPISNGTVRFAYYGTGGELGVTTTVTIPTSQWSHLALTHNGGAITVYVNGFKAATGTVSGTPAASVGYLQLGYNYGTSLNAYIDDLRITPGVVRYGTDFTPPERAFNDEAFNDPHYNAVSLLLHMDGTNDSTTFTDSSVNGLTVTANGDAKISTAQSRFGGASAYFDGTGDYVSLTSSAGFGVGTGDFTLEAWIFASDTSVNRCIVSLRASSPSIPVDYGNNLAIEAGKLAFSNGSTWTSGATTVTTNMWHHVAVTRTSGSMNLWLNGRADRASWTDTSNFGSSRPAAIGATTDQYNFFAGYIDELRITKGVARYTSNFLPPTLPFYNTTIPTVDPSFSSVSLLLHMNGSNGSTTFTDSSSNALAVTANGNAQISTAQSKFGGASGLFDGTGDTLSVPTGAQFDLGTGNFTVEAWVYATSLAVDRGIYYYGSANTNRFQMQVNSNGALAGYIETSGVSASIVSSASTIPLNTWKHVTFTRDGTTLRLFVDGILAASLTSSVSAPAGQVPYVGYATTASTARYWQGYIDDLRITKGVARYTSNFYIPRAAFPDA